MSQPPVVYIPAIDQKPGVWQGGQMREIFRDPPDADFPDGDYRLWVGTATIERSSDYSYFPRAERMHVLLSGGRLRLHFREPEQTVALASQESHTFCGTRPLHAEVLGAPVFAFNLLYRRGLISGAVFMPLTHTPHLYTISTEAGIARTQIVYVVSGIVALESADGEILLTHDDTLLWEISGPLTKSLCVRSQTADALLLFAHVSGPRLQPTTSA